MFDATIFRSYSNAPRFSFDAEKKRRLIKRQMSSATTTTTTTTATTITFHRKSSENVSMYCHQQFLFEKRVTIVLFVNM